MYPTSKSDYDTLVMESKSADFWTLGEALRNTLVMHFIMFYFDISSLNYKHTCSISTMLTFSFH